MFHALAVLAVAMAGPTCPPEDGITAPAAQGVVRAASGFPGRSAASACNPCRVEEMEAHRASGVVSVWLTNNVRVHHKFIERDPKAGAGVPAVVVEVSFFGGELLEDEGTRGLSLIASSAFRPIDAGAGRASSGKGAVGVLEALVRAGVMVDGDSTPDAIVVSASGTAASLLAGADALGALVSGGGARVLRPGAEALREEAMQEIASRAVSDAGIVSDSLVDLTFPGREARTRFLSPPQVQRHDARDAQRWLDRMLAESPVEAAVVGNISLEDALSLVERALGPLPARARPCQGSFSQQRSLQRPRGPLTGEYVRPTPRRSAFVVRGFFGADADAVRDHRALAVAARVMVERVRGRVGTRDVSGDSIPSSVYPGFGMVIAAATVEPANAGCTLAAMDHVTAELLRSGPTHEEVRHAAAELVERVRRYEADPRYWASVLRRATARGIDPDELYNGEGVYQSLTAQDVRSTLRKYATEEGAIRLVVRPE